jgi:hypothetical protein
MKRVYLDSNILIAYYSQDKTEESKRKMVQDALAVFAQLKDSQLCTSMWAVTEMVNILVSRKTELYLSQTVHIPATCQPTRASRFWDNRYMAENNQYCDTCKHSVEAHRFGHCMELKSTTLQEPNPAVFSPKCSCKGFVPKG